MMSGFRAAAQVGLLMFVPLYLTDVLEAGPMMTGVGFSDAVGRGAFLPGGRCLVGPYRQKADCCRGLPSGPW